MQRFEYKGTSKVTSTDLTKATKKLKSYFKYLKEVSGFKAYAFPESSLHLPFDAEQLKKSLALAKAMAGPKLKYVIVVGIGGSNLGTKAIYDAILGHFDVLECCCYPKMLFADTTHPEFLAALTVLLRKVVRSPDEVLINVISKSGSTTETAVNAEIILDALGKRFKNPEKRLVITTDVGSKLWKIGEKKLIPMLGIPQAVGGRYSVFSSVGLFPLAAVGFDVKALINGAASALRTNLEPSSKNQALISAAVASKHYHAGKNILDHFFFNSELETLGKWLRQLLGESLGKEKDLKGRVAHIGITPTVSIGSTDLHSVGQLYLGGPKDKLTTFISAGGFDGPAVPRRERFPIVKGIAGMKAGDVRSAILSGVKAAYLKKGLPFTETVLGRLDERSLGEFMQTKMIETMLLAQLLGVDAFDQPNVELYKKETRRLLEG